MKKKRPGESMRHSAEKLKYVEDLAAYIEEHLGEELLTDMLAEKCYVSKGKLYQDFTNATGHPVKEYIRKRRLSNALALIKNSELPDAAIAYECGYSSQQAMCRSIQASLAMTPGQYRKTEDYYFFPAYRGGAVFDIHVGQEKLPALFGFRFYQRSPLGIENKALAMLLEKVPDFSGQLLGRNGQQRGAYFCYELYVTQETVCQKLLGACREKESGRGKELRTEKEPPSGSGSMPKKEIYFGRNCFSGNGKILEHINFTHNKNIIYNEMSEEENKAREKHPHANTSEEGDRTEPKPQNTNTPEIENTTEQKYENKQKTEGMQAIAGTELQEKLRTQEKVQGWFEKGTDFPETSPLFVTLEVNNQEKMVNDAWDYLCKSWLPGSMYEQDGADYFEEYNLHSKEAKTLKLMLPIRKTKEYLKITVEKFPERSYLVGAGYGVNAKKQAVETLGHLLDQCKLEYIRNNKEFYYQENLVYDKLTHNLSTRFLCGTPLEGFPQTYLEQNMAGVKTCPAGYYIVMRGKMPRELSGYQEILAVFAEQNHLSLTEEDAFCLVFADDGFQNARLEFQGKITFQNFQNPEQNDNTAGEGSDTKRLWSGNPGNYPQNG